MKINEMAFHRSEAIDRCCTLGKKFTKHFEKIYMNRDSESFNHWASEMQAWFNEVHDIVLKHSNKRISTTQLMDWFFTRGSTTELIFHANYDIIDKYEIFITKLLNNLNVKKSLKEVFDVENNS